MPLVAALAMATATHPAAAQRLYGRLLDLNTEQPVSAGILTLLAADGTTNVVNSVADDNGYWTLDAPAPGSYWVAARRIGYQAWVSGPITLAPGDSIESVYHLRPVAVMLDPVEVEAVAVRRNLELAGFYDRQHSNFGHFITPEAIERRNAARVTDILRAVPGVNVVMGGSGSAGARYIQLRGSNLSFGGLCRPRVFVDGLLYARGDSRPRRLRDSAGTELFIEEAIRQLDEGLTIDDIGPPSTIAAIEVYRSASQVPVQFGGTSVETLCGVIVVWTRRGTGFGAQE